MFTRYANKQAVAVSVVCRYEGKADRCIFSLTEARLKRKCVKKWGPGRLRIEGPQMYEWVRDGDTKRGF